MGLLRIFGLGIVLTGFFAMPALAGFRVCNSTPDAQSVSIGYKSGDDWVSEGWWTVNPDECKLLQAEDLTVRFFYYRATVNGGEFEGERYMFCTDSGPYTIVGDTECEARGYSNESFSQVEIGKGVTDFELTLVASGTSAPTAPKSTSETESGTYGDPFSVSAVFQGCEQDGDYSYCAFHGDGWKWYAYKGEGTTPSMMQEMGRLRTGDLVDISGDLITFNDVSVEAAIRSVSTHGPRDEAENLMAGLQGRWRDSEDPASVMVIHGGEVSDYYDGELLSVNFLQFADQCDGSFGEGPVMIQTLPEDPEPFCYVVLGWDAVSLQTSYVGGMGAGDRFYEKIR